MPVKVIAGNWKMHHGPDATRRFLRDFEPSPAGEAGAEVLLFPPAISVVAAL